MKRHWAFGWIAAAIAIVTILIILIDIVHTQSGNGAVVRPPAERRSDLRAATGGEFPAKPVALAGASASADEDNG